MKTQRVLIILLVAAFVVATATPFCAAQTLSKPNVTLPSGWELSDEIDYPNEVSEYDPEGAGLLEYQDSDTFDFVMIYYEKAPSGSYTSTQLKSEVEGIFYRDHEGLSLDESGTTTYAGVQTGFAKSYEAEYNVYHLELVMIKGDYYMNIYAVYDASSAAAEDNVESLINSINTDSGLLGGNILFIIGIIVVIIVVVVVLLLVMKRRKKAAPAQMPTYQGSMPIPPPPPT